MENVTIGQFYSGRSVFITGATGFMGKVLVEKLLRSCPDVNRLYLLLRESKTKSIDCRLDELTRTPVFDRIRRERPDALAKLVPVGGDILLPQLGLSLFDMQMMNSDNVSVVFHLAARIKFDDNLRGAITTNVKGVQEVVAFCRHLRSLKAFVHVSTVYNNLDRDEISEEVYPGNLDPQKLVDLVDCMDDALLASITKQLVGACPNVYAYTKALGEQLLEGECLTHDIPLVIVRPSIVTASLKEPMPGWIDNINGPTGLLVGVGKGLLRVLRINPNMIGDLIPVDVTVNLMIASAWSKAVHDSGSRGVRVYNCSSGSLNPITWSQFQQYAEATAHVYPIREILWYPKATMRVHPLVNSVEVFLYHYVPAYGIDTIMRLCGKKPFLVRLYNKAHRALSCLEFYCLREWRFASANRGRLLDRMSLQDRNTFDFDVGRVCWRSYVETYCDGVRTYILKENPENLPEARRNLKRMYWIQVLFRVLLIGAVFVVFGLFVRRSLDLHCIYPSHLEHNETIASFYVDTIHEPRNCPAYFDSASRSQRVH